MVYFYNPFDREIFVGVLDNLLKSLAAAPRDCWIVYASSKRETLGWVRPLVLGSGQFTEVATQPMPQFWDAVRGSNFAVFRRRG